MTQTIFLAGGCFWCTEAIFLSLKGVLEANPVYLGGNTRDPKYEDICTGQTGHAEAIQCIFDENKIRLSKILEIFFKTHNPTELNRQGNDVGTQYRSEIFVVDDSQLKIAKQSIVDAEKLWEAKVHTKVTMINKFYPAEDYHKNYYLKNTQATYCKFIIKPKINFLEKNFKNLLKN